MVFYRSTWFPLLSACRFVEFDTSVICRVFMHCFGSFLFQAMFLSSVLVSKYLLFQGTKYEINREDVVYLHSTLWRRSQLWLELFASTVVDYHEYHICPNTCFFGDALALLWVLKNVLTQTSWEYNPHREYNQNTVKKWNNSSTLCVIYDGIYARSSWSADSSAGSVFRQTVGMDPGSNLFAFPSMWNNLVKMFRTNHEPALRIEIFSV